MLLSSFTLFKKKLTFKKINIFILSILNCGERKKVASCRKPVFIRTFQYNKQKKVGLEKFYKYVSNLYCCNVPEKNVVGIR